MRHLQNVLPALHPTGGQSGRVHVTSSLTQSTVRQVGRRVKGTEKFWSEGRSETMLQLRAGYLSDTAAISLFWENWQKPTNGRRVC